MTTWNSGYPIPNPPASWTDTLTPGSTKIRRVHLIELREFLEQMDAHYHVFDTESGSTRIPTDTYSWTVPSASIVAGQTKVRYIDFSELRDALAKLDGHYHTAHGRSSSVKDINTSWTSGSIVAGTKVRADHVKELRNTTAELTSHTHYVCCECESTCSCQCTCTCECTCWGEI